jgi:preprotein translocase subunit SecG
MSNLATIIPYIQIAVSVLLIIAILLQHSDAGLGAGFGGSSDISTWRTRRGFEKTLFISTMVLAVIFVLSALVSVLINQ